MRKILLPLTIIFHFALAQEAEVTNIQAAQRTDGSKIVDILFEITPDDVFEFFYVTIEVSFDNGDTFEEIEHASGDIPGCTAGINNVEWNFGWQYDGVNSNEVIYKIIASSTAILPYEGELPFEVISIPAGEFTFGEGDTIKTIDYDYEIMKYEVTNGEYAVFLMEALEQGSITISSSTGPFGIIHGPYIGGEYLEPMESVKYINLMHSKIRWTGEVFEVLEGFGNHPVTSVTWFGAVAFANHYSMELPSLEEWEKAARGMTGYDFPWGNDITDSNLNHGQVDSWYEMTTPVGSFNGDQIEHPNFSENTVGEPCVFDSYGDDHIGLLSCDLNCLWFDNTYTIGNYWCDNNLNCEEFVYDGGDCGDVEQTCEEMGLLSDCDGRCFPEHGFEMIMMNINDMGLCYDGTGMEWDPEWWFVNLNCEEYDYSFGMCGRDEGNNGHSGGRDGYDTVDSPSPYGLYDMAGNVEEFTSVIDEIYYNEVERLRYRVLTKGWGYSGSIENPFGYYTWRNLEVWNYGQIWEATVGFRCVRRID